MWGLCHDETGSAVLLGEFEQRLDDKKRITLPARLRARFEQGLVCARGLDGCISVFPRDAWDDYVSAQSERLDLFTREGRALERYLFGGALECELDRQGRVALPAPLVGHASLDREIVIAGLRDRLEIWDRESWRSQLAHVEGSAEVVAERIANARP
jgi:MraZ protein